VSVPATHIQVLRATALYLETVLLYHAELEGGSSKMAAGERRSKGTSDLLFDGIRPGLAELVLELTQLDSQVSVS